MAMLDLKDPRCSDMFDVDKKYIITFHFNEKNEETAKKIFRSFYKSEEFLPNMCIDGIYGNMEAFFNDNKGIPLENDFAFRINQLRWNKASENIKYVEKLSEDEMIRLNQGEDNTYNTFREWVRESDAFIEKYFSHVGYVDKERGFVYHDDYYGSKDFVEVINSMFSNRLVILYGMCKSKDVDTNEIEEQIKNQIKLLDDYLLENYGDSIEHFDGTYEFRYVQ